MLAQLLKVSNAASDVAGTATGDGSLAHAWSSITGQSIHRRDTAIDPLDSVIRDEVYENDLKLIDDGVPRLRRRLADHGGRVLSTSSRTKANSVLGHVFGCWACRYSVSATRPACPPVLPRPHG